MRVVTNEKLIERNRRIAQILFFASIAALAASFFFTNSFSEDNQQIAFYFQCLMLPLMLSMVIISVRMTNTWVRQPNPWEAIREGLKGTGGDTTIYNFLMPARHVLVSPHGIFSLTTRFQDAPQEVNGDTWKTKAGIITFMRQEHLGNPTSDALLDAAKTEVFLQELLGDEDIKVHPVIVFIHPNAEVKTEGEQTVPILYANADKKKGSLKSFLRDAKKNKYPTLTDEQREKLDNLLLYKD